MALTGVARRNTIALILVMTGSLACETEPSGPGDAGRAPVEVGAPTPEPDGGSSVAWDGGPATDSGAPELGAGVDVEPLPRCRRPRRPEVSAS